MYYFNDNINTTINLIIIRGLNFIIKYFMMSKNKSFQEVITNNLKLSFLDLLLILFLSLSFQQVKAQTSTRQFDTYHEHMDFYLSKLIKTDTNYFKSGILYDRVFPMANLNAFNSDSNNTSSYSHFMRAWDELYLANTKENFFFNGEIAREMAFSMEMKDTVAIGIINLDYTSIDTTALDSLTLVQGTGSLTLDSEGILARSTGQNPYIDHHKLIVSPLSRKTVKSNNVTLALSPLMIWNATKSIDKLSASFGNQNVILLNDTIVENKTASFNFTSSGTKNIKFTVDFSDGTTMSTYGQINVYIPSADELLSLSQIQTITATDPFVGYNEPYDSDGTCYGNGEYQVFLADNQTKLTNPIILMDGFDPDDTRGIDQENKKHAGSIIKLMEYFEPNNPDPINIQVKLNSEGYDVIVLNFTSQYLFSKIDFVYGYTGKLKKILSQTTGFIISQDGDKFGFEWDYYRDGGADYIERNANVLKELIRQTNLTLTTNQSDSSLTIIGPSMGGLISRVALTQMEQNNEDHNIKIYLSFDSPHKGANISIGVQNLVNRTNERDSKYELNTPASKQMLLNHYTQQDNSELPQEHPFRSNHFAPLLNSLGFPVQTDRNLSWINGTLNGGTNGVAGEKFVNLKVNKWYSKAWVKLWRTKDTGESKTLSYKVPSHSSQQWYSTTNTSKGSLDASPGGAIALKESVIDGWNKKAVTKIKLLWLVTIVDIPAAGNPTTTPDEETCFIPSKSALAYTGSNELWREDISCTNLVCMGWTPFDNYYAPENNEFHVSVSHQGVEWFLKELAGTPEYMYNQGCENFETEIVGNSTVCYINTETYTLNNDCGVSYWETSGGIDILNSDSYSATIKNNSSNSVHKWIKAVLLNGEEIVKTIGSKPRAFWGLNSYNSFAGEYELRIEPFNIDWEDQNITDVVWTQTGGNGILTVEDQYEATVSEPLGEAFMLFGNVTITNDCGSTTKSFVATNTDITFDDGYYPSDLFILDSFEGLNSYIVIDPEQIGESQIESSELLDLYGYVVEEFIHNEDEISIEHPSGEPAIRVLKVTMNGKEAQRLILVQ